MNATITLIKSESDEDYSEDSGLENYIEEDKTANKDVLKFEMKAGSTPSDMKTV